jgi:hypothetical protein
LDILARQDPEQRDTLNAALTYALYRLNSDSLKANMKGVTDIRNAWKDRITPAPEAVDSNYAYYHSGVSLEVWNRRTGLAVASIEDPFGSDSGYSYHGAPMIGSRDNVVSFAGDAFSGTASSSTEQYEQRVLSSFNIKAKTFEWATGNAYLTAPAVANGVIYAARNEPMALDAMDESTGEVLWSWTPAGAGDESFHHNIVVTQNLLFVSTDRAVYALDLASRKPLWSYQGRAC